MNSNTAVNLLMALGVNWVGYFKDRPLAHHTKKGPGRRHREGELDANHPEFRAFGNKLARKAIRGNAA
jgi:hypothetical protein